MTKEMQIMPSLIFSAISALIEFTAQWTPMGVSMVPYHGDR